MKQVRKTGKILQPQRIWETDAVRGFLILSVLCYHLYMTVEAFCITGYYNIDSVAYVRITDPLQFWFQINDAGKVVRSAFPKFAVKYMQPLWFDMFFIISGISCHFSKDNFRRGLKMLVGAFIVSGFTSFLAIWTGDASQFIRFGVLHCYAYCHLIYYFLFERRSNRGLLLAALGVFVVGYYLRYNPVYSDFALLYPFGIHEKGAAGRDYWPIFPMLGWMLVGVVLGRRFYSEKKSLWPDSPLKTVTSPLQWLGRYSGVLYIVHIFIYTAVFCGIGWIFHLF